VVLGIGILLQIRESAEPTLGGVGFPDPRLENETKAGLHIIIKGAENEGEEEAPM